MKQPDREDEDEGQRRLGRGVRAGARMDHTGHGGPPRRGRHETAGNASFMLPSGPVQELAVPQRSGKSQQRSWGSRVGQDALGEQPSRSGAMLEGLARTAAIDDEGGDTGPAPTSRTRAGWGASDDAGGLPCPQTYSNMALMWTCLPIAQQRMMVQKAAERQLRMTNRGQRAERPQAPYRAGWRASDDVNGLPCPDLYAFMAPTWANLPIAQQRTMVQEVSEHQRMMTNLRKRAERPPIPERAGSGASDDVEGLPCPDLNAFMAPTWANLAISQQQMMMQQAGAISQQQVMMQQAAAATNPGDHSWRPTPERAGSGASDDVDGLPCPDLYAFMAPTWANLPISQQQMMVQQAAAISQQQMIMQQAAIAANPGNRSRRPRTESDDSTQAPNPHDLYAQQMQAAMAQVSGAIAQQLPSMMEIRQALNPSRASIHADGRGGTGRTPPPGMPTTADSPPPGRADRDASDDEDGLPCPEQYSGFAHVWPTFTVAQQLAMTKEASRITADPRSRMVQLLSQQNPAAAGIMQQLMQRDAERREAQERRRIDLEKRKEEQKRKEEHQRAERLRRAEEAPRLNEQAQRERASTSQQPTDVDGRHANRKTCWQRLVALGGSLTECRVAMFVYALLALFPVLDFVVDIWTAADFAINGHPWWAAFTLVIFYMSGRFVVLFMTLYPTPSAWNLLALFVPGCWQVVVCHVDARMYILMRYFPRKARQVLDLQGAGIVRRGAAADATDVDGRTLADQYARQAGTNEKLVKMTRNGFTTRAKDMLKTYPPDTTASRSYLLFVALRAEILLFPYACSAVVPVGISAWELFTANMNAALGRADNPDDGSDLSSAKGIREKIKLFHMTASTAEALFEGVPQLALRARAGIYGDELGDLVFRVSFSWTAFSLLKAIVTFLLNSKRIWAMFSDLSGEDVVRFSVKAVGDEEIHELDLLRLGIVGRFVVATPADVIVNPVKLRDPRTGLDAARLAYLTDGMQVHGPAGNYRLEPNIVKLEYTLYAFKSKMNTLEQERLFGDEDEAGA